MVKTSFMKPFLLALIAVVGTSDLAMGREEKNSGKRGRKVEEEKHIRGLKSKTPKTNAPKRGRSALLL